MTRTPLFVLLAAVVALASPVQAQTPAAAPAPTAATAPTAAAPRASTPPLEAAAKPTRATASDARSGTSPGRTAPRGGSTRAMDSLELDTTQITGNRELPKVMVVVPWKRSDIGDLVGKPINSLVDEALEPVDREVFRREVDYYGALAPDRPAAMRSETGVTGSAGAPRAEK
jgi:hypothetical protein